MFRANVGLKQPGRSLALAGAFWGTASALFLGGLRFALGGEPRFWLERLPGDVAFLAVYLIPYLISRWALRFRSQGARVAVWLGAGVLSFLALFTSFTYITLVFVPAGILLLFAAFRNFPALGLRTLGVTIFATLGLILVGVFSFHALFAQEDPRCWVLVSGEQGQFWEERPYSTSMSFGPNDVQGTCTSDITSPMEAALSLGVWVVGSTLLALFYRVTGAGKSASTSEG